MTGAVDSLFGMGYSMVTVDAIEPGGPGGAVRFVRRELGVQAFGINDPETRRVPIAGPEGMTVLAVGARRGSYEPRGPF